MNNRCCEEMEAFSGEIKNSVAPCVFWRKEDGMLDELGTFEGVPNIVFRFCPYCGKALDRERLTVTKGDLLGALRKAVALADASKMDSPLRRTVELEEAIDRVQSIVNAATTDDFEG